MKRQRGRGRKPNHNNSNRNFESNGPEIKVRGSASTIYDKYQQLARDAASSGDRIKAESFLQHAEHYFRIVKTQQAAQQAAQRDRADSDNRDTDRGGDSFSGGDGASTAGSDPLGVVTPEGEEGSSRGEAEAKGDDSSGRRPRRQRRSRPASPNKDAADALESVSNDGDATETAQGA